MRYAGMALGAVMLLDGGFLWLVTVSYLAQPPESLADVVGMGIAAGSLVQLVAGVYMMRHSWRNL